MSGDETETDLEREREIAAKIEQYWGCKLVKIPKKYYNVDYAITRPDPHEKGQDEIIGYIEIKNRNFNHDKYPTSFITLKKWLGLLLVSERMTLPVYLAINFQDSLRMIRVETMPLKHNLRGPNSRGKDEQEPVVNIPIEKLKEISPTKIVHEIEDTWIARTRRPQVVEKTAATYEPKRIA